MKLKTKKLLSFISVIAVSLVSIQSVNAYTTHVIDKKTNHFLNQMVWSSNLYPVEKVNNTASFGMNYGDINSENGKITIGYNGPNMPMQDMYYLVQLSENSPITNKEIIDKVGIKVKPGVKYKLSYDVIGNNGFDTQIFLYFANFDYSKTTQQVSASPNIEKVEYVFEVPYEMEYLVPSIEPYWNDFKNGSFIEYSNIQIKELL